MPKKISLEQKVEQLKKILKSKLLSEEELDCEQPYGEDGSIYAFERGQEYGAHYLAEEILSFLK